MAERNDWRDYFESEKAKRVQLNNEMTVLEQDLNQHVYALFKLTKDEIYLIEAEVR